MFADWLQSKKTWGITSMVLVGVLFVSFNRVAHQLLQGARLDLTQDKQFTLSDGTRHILSSLQEPVQLDWYYSRKLAHGSPGMQAHAQRIIELLRTYERVSGGQVQVREIDPEPFSEAEDEALAYGLTGYPMQDGGESFYLGLVGRGSTDQEAIVPFFQMERGAFLEYDLTKLVYQLSDIPKTRVGIVQAPGPRAPMGSPDTASILEPVSQLFDVSYVGLDAKSIPDDVNVLLAIGAQAFPKRMLFALDQFVLRGGRLLMCVDPLPESTVGSPPELPEALAQLLAAWGLRLPPDQVVADRAVAKKVWYNHTGRTAVVRYPIWMDLTEEQLDQSDVITAKLSPLTLGTVGHLELIEQEGVQITPLLQSSEEAMLVSRADVARYVHQPDSLLTHYQPEGQRYILGARVSGLVNTAFPKGDPSQQEADGTTDDAKPPLLRAQEPIQVVVVADVDWLQDRFWLQVQNFLGHKLATPTAANGHFLLHAVDHLSGSSDLMHIRAQTRFSRPFTRMRRMEQAAEVAYQATENNLKEQLKATEVKLQELEAQKNEGNLMVLDAAQRAEVERFRQEKLKIRKQLREVRHALRQDMDRLQGVIRLVNVYLWPVIVGCAGAYGLMWRRRRLAAMAAAARTKAGDAA